MNAQLRAEQAAINLRMQRWSDAEIARFPKRVALFQRRGMGHAQAERVADSLALRDQDRDERRMCVECESWQQSRTCRKGLPTSFDQLARCVGFTWQKP